MILLFGLRRLRVAVSGLRRGNCRAVLTLCLKNNKVRILTLDYLKSWTGGDSFGLVGSKVAARRDGAVADGGRCLEHLDRAGEVKNMLYRKKDYNVVKGNFRIKVQVYLSRVQFDPIQFKMNTGCNKPVTGEAAAEEASPTSSRQPNRPKLWAAV